MFHRTRGFSLLELMIVILLIAIIAAIVIPNLLAGRLAANETAAVATLRTLTAAQAQFQQGGRADENGDGTGEYGGFLEMSGAAAGRMSSPLVPPVIPGAFRNLANPTSEASRSGYLFRMYLPAAGGTDGVAETWNTGFAPGDLEVALAETTWCCYAWPALYNQTGNRTYFVNQAGDILSLEFDFGGVGGGPAPDAAFQVPNDITSQPDLGGPGQAGAGVDWRLVGQ